MKVRPLSWLLAASMLIACDGGLEFTRTTTLVNATSPDNGNSSSSDSSSSDALMITGAVLLAISVAGTTVVFTAEDSDSFSYLQRHQQEVRVAIVRGDGPFVTDVAQHLKLPRALVPHLGATLRRARPELEPTLAGGRMDRARANTFARSLVQAITQDPILAPYLDDFLLVASAR